MERMISLERCRKALAPNDRVSDEDLVTLREQLYCFAELILDVKERSKESFKASLEQVAFYRT